MRKGPLFGSNVHDKVLESEGRLGNPMIQSGEAGTVESRHVYQLHMFSEF